MNLLKGQKADVTKGRNVRKLSLHFGWKTTNAAMSIDASCFVLSDRGRCERDEDFIFYGNPVDRSGALAHASLQSHDRESVTITLDKLQPAAAKLAFSVTIHEGEKLGHAMKDVSGLYVRLVNADTGEELFRYEYGSDLAQETAVVVGELYRYNGEWKFNAIGSGYHGGLEALCTSFGLELEASGSAAPEVAAAVATPAPLSTIDLRKKLVQLTLEKKKLTGVVARVGIVLDITGSMQTLYRNGTVQEVVERILAVACKFDDNATLDVWVYDNHFSRLPSVTERDFSDYVHRQILNDPQIHKFGRNNEPPVMEDVIRKYTEEDPSSTPVLIIFINDGGVVKPIKKVLTASSVQPIFWQFVGIGQSDFEVLKKLNTMEGRVVDNANFVHLDDIAAVSDEALYDQLLNEFPSWLQAAKAKRIIRS
ncbi:stress response protein SCP2 [Paenibacillus phyllosphaerae]|uniref:Stress response protein SCP2 n=1 Tax=Paenibacillus phyllosphaerae TaxID=274593 RepID=A0A7W5FNU2_9BACL|nr:VWA domain-containing protein [Paenibacillus phyllosphaerae]MBB3111359.1 stress response protein SCP2 [Paenibacillus phyllosphaerae]